MCQLRRAWEGIFPKSFPKKPHLAGSVSNLYAIYIPFIYLSLFILKKHPTSSHPFQFLFKQFNLFQLELLSTFTIFKPGGNGHLLDRDAVWKTGCGRKLEIVLPHHGLLFLSFLYGFLAVVDWAY